MTPRRDADAVPAEYSTACAYMLKQVELLAPLCPEHLKHPQCSTATSPPRLNPCRCTASGLRMSVALTPIRLSATLAVVSKPPQQSTPHHGTSERMCIAHRFRARLIYRPDQNRINEMQPVCTRATAAAAAALVAGLLSLSQPTCIRRVQPCCDTTHAHTQHEHT